MEKALIVNYSSVTITAFLAAEDLHEDSEYNTYKNISYSKMKQFMKSISEKTNMIND